MTLFTPAFRAKAQQFRPGRFPNIARGFSYGRRCLIDNNSQHKDSVEPRSDDYSKSGSDDGVAALETAFDPSDTSPEGQLQSAGRESKKDSNPLDVSPANQGVSDLNDTQNDGCRGLPSESGRGAEDKVRVSRSGSGSPDKGKDVQKYQE
ncbi:hypothetical protein E4T44_13477 [Aureobasidium sp. EXF-8845]|nr:hypothetical protein E4T44_13477 [Aureobasidium sp. EXF-8845]KAI4846063.1 hypothetical protein E4T45_07423 [Aureobasidium sp. EXF-8846]